jgi:hypothetical protein
MARRTLALLAICSAGCTTSPGHFVSQPARVSTAKAREMRGGVFVSEALPALRLTPGPGLVYLGAHPFRIGAIAAGERHVFVDQTNGVVRRLLVLQFESILPASTEEYRYRITNPVELGGIPYRHSVHFYRLSDSIGEAPDSELALTVEFLKERGLTLPEEQAMARYARVIGADRKHELLIFYHESLADWGRGGVDALAIDGSPRPEVATLARDFSERARKSFTIADPDRPLASGRDRR